MTLEKPLLVAEGAVGLLCAAVAASLRWPSPDNLSASIRANAAKALMLLTACDDLKVGRPWHIRPIEMPVHTVLLSLKF
jgi:hypothetical protein